MKILISQYYTLQRGREYELIPHVSNFLTDPATRDFNAATYKIDFARIPRPVSNTVSGHLNCYNTSPTNVSGVYLLSCTVR